ncbi:hypothetical protein JW968_05260 [Candidatus Woesearchaeota archaeon]|nr:hypothetical protein [Candidatus Woesearchaeota archaeon]
MKKRIILVPILILVLFIWGCSSTTNKSETDLIFEECEQDTSNNPLVSYVIDEDCLIEKADSIEQCKDYEGKTTYSGMASREFTQEDVEKCIFTLAVTNLDANMCEELISTKNDCFMQVAKGSYNHSICLKTENVTACYQQYDLYHTKCKNDTYNYMVTNIACGFSNLKITQEDMEIGNTICDLSLIPTQLYDEEERPDVCLAAMGVYFKDTSLCDDAGEFKGDCYVGLARIVPEFSLADCDNAGVNYVGCYVAVAVKNKDPSICAKLPEGNKESCISSISSQTTSYSSCVEIFGDESESCAEYFAPRMKPEEYTMGFCESLIKIGRSVGGPPLDQCFYEVATRTLNLEACDKIRNLDSVNECKTVVNHALN